MKILKGKRSYKNPVPGDLFIFRTDNPKCSIGIGCVVIVDAKCLFYENCIIIYIYDEWISTIEDLNESNLKKDKLLLPPIIIDKSPWTKGYFQTIKNLELTDEDIFINHCFKHINGKYYDEYANELSEPLNLVGSASICYIGEIERRINEIT
jgi:hypothetical protein